MARKAAAQMSVSLAVLNDEPVLEMCKTQLRTRCKEYGGTEPFLFSTVWSWITDPETGDRIQVPYLVCVGPMA